MQCLIARHDRLVGAVPPGQLNRQLQTISGWHRNLESRVDVKIEFKRQPVHSLRSGLSNE